MIKKKAGKNKTSEKRTSKKKQQRRAAPTASGPAQQLRIVGSWVVRRVDLTPPETTIGVLRESKFEIKPAGTEIVLKKKANVAWNAGSSDPIPLHDLPLNHPDRKQGMVVGATVELGGKDFELTLGRKDKTLKIQLVPVVGDMTNPGGSGSAGRGG
jgi:hypothetical protein